MREKHKTKKKENWSERKEPRRWRFSCCVRLNIQMSVRFLPFDGGDGGGSGWDGAFRLRAIAIVSGKEKRENRKTINHFNRNERRQRETSSSLVLALVAKHMLSDSRAIRRHRQRRGNITSHIYRPFVWFSRKPYIFRALSRSFSIAPAARRLSSTCLPRTFAFKHAEWKSRDTRAPKFWFQGTLLLSFVRFHDLFPRFPDCVVEVTASVNR